MMEKESTANRTGWPETEVRAAVEAYFKVLDSEQEGQAVNKRQVYRDLAARFPRRGEKAFELKFQNISAILYEQRLPYCSGLKPRFNYQRLLRLMVLDHIDRTPLPAVEPHEILLKKLRELRQRGSIPVTKGGSGRFGLAIEQALGIVQNSDKAADFMGIELKTKSDGTLQTLFSRTPSRYVQDADKRGMFDRHCYFDESRNRRALYTSFNSEPDSLGFCLVPADQVVRVTRAGVLVLEYDAELIEEALLSKHSHTAFILVKSCKANGADACTVEGAHFCKWPSVIKFMRLVAAGDVYLDFTMSEDAQGRVKDHGFLWRIRSSAIETLYLHTKAASWE
jgi:hypothetical protein